MECGGALRSSILGQSTVNFSQLGHPGGRQVRAPFLLDLEFALSRVA